MYLSHFMQKGCERVVCERWVGDWTDCNILTPSSSDYCSTSFLIPQGCSNGGPEGPSPQLGDGSHGLELQLELQLPRTVCGTRLYHCLTSTCFLWASHLHRIKPVHMSRWYIRLDAPVSQSKVNMLQMKSPRRDKITNFWLRLLSFIRSSKIFE